MAGKYLFMEKVEKDLESFWNSLLDLLKEPWKAPPVIQDHDSMDEDMFGFYFNRLSMPYCIIVWYLCKTKVHFLRYALENEDVIPTNLFIQSSRLTSHELYDAFSFLKPDNATLLLDRLDCPVSVYTEIKESLETGDKTRFISAIDGIDLSGITPFLKLVRFLIDKFPKWIEKISDSDQTTDSDAEAEKKKNLFEAENIATRYLKTNSKEMQLLRLGMKKAENLVEIPDSFFKGWYSVLFYQYCDMKEDGALNESDIKAFEYVFHQPAFEEQYNENLQWWEDGIMDDKMEEYAKEWGFLEIIENKEAIDTQSNARASSNDIEQPKKEDGWRLQNYLNREIKLDIKSKLSYCIGFKKSIAEAGSAGDRALTKFIQGIADLGYIDDDRVTKKSFAYALTGRGGFRGMVIKKVTWHHKKEDTREIPESVRVLLFISSNLFDPELTRGKTYSQIFEVLNAGTNPCIKGGKDQSASYYDKVSGAFKSFYEECFKDALYNKNTAK